MIYDKSEVIDYIWQYSKYYGNLLISCEELSKERNLNGHANLSKYNIIFLSEDKELLYPLTENETGIKFYDLISKIIFNLILKIISSNLIIPINVDLDKEIEKFNITIKEITTEQLLEYKGINYKILKGWNEMPEIEKYKMAENTSDVNHYVQLFQMMGFIITNHSTLIKYVWHFISVFKR